jgi:hypothetical protein
MYPETIGDEMVRFWCARILVGVTLMFVVTPTVGKSSKLVMSWKNPAYVRSKPFARVLALGLSDKAKIRADFEDALAAQLAETGMETIAGNTILLRPEGTNLDLQYLRTQVRENKLDAVVVSRLIKVDNTVTYVPGTAYIPPPLPYYGTFYGYYGAVYPTVYTPGYLKEEKKVRIETNLYVISSGEGELVWTGITDTFNPSNVDKAIDRLVKLVVKQMRDDGAL